MTAPIEPTDPSNLFTPFLPTTINFPEEEDRHRSFLVDQFSNYADVINDKRIGNFVQQAENFNGEKWVYNTTKIVRNGYDTLAYIPSFPNAGVLILTVDTSPAFPLSNIDNQWVITDLYGTASKPPTAVGAGDGDFIKFNNRGDPRIFFDMSDTTITITTTVDLTAYSGFIVILYLRNGT